MSLIATDQEIEDWVLLLHTSGISSMTYVRGELHAVYDEDRKRKACATMKLLAKRLGQLTKLGRTSFLTALQSCDGRRADELEAYRLEGARALDPEDDSPAHTLRLLAPQVH